MTILIISFVSKSVNNLLSVFMTIVIDFGVSSIQAERICF
jgi:hypothetical protein